VDFQHPQSSSQVCTINEVGTLELTDTLVLRNHEESNDTQEISINYTSSEELHDCNTKIVNSYIPTTIPRTIGRRQLMLS
jgi:hypothetical protein